MEKITAILKDQIFRINDEEYPTYQGYIIVTTKQNILIGIGSEQSCCENWGYFDNLDDLQSFIGANLIDIKAVDLTTDKKSLKEMSDRGVSFNNEEVEAEKETMFIDIETDLGVIQIGVYNSHNGYYGHEVKVVSTQLKIEKSL